MFKKFLKVLLPLQCSVGFAAVNNLSNVLQQDFAAYPDAHMGMVVLDAKTGQVLYQNNSQQYFHPASNTKLFTAIAAMLSLGGGYQFATTINTKPQALENGVVQGNVYIHFSGDPSFSHQDLNTLLADLKTAGVQQIQGNVVLVNTVFSNDLFALGRVSEDSMWAFGAPATSIIVDENGVSVCFKPNTPVPEITQVGSSFVQVHAHLIWGQPDNKLCSFEAVDGAGNTLNLEGCLPTRLGGTIGLDIPDPDLYAADLVRRDLVNLGIQVHGKILTGPMPSTANVVLAQHYSLPLKELLTTMLKNSDNIYASAITKTLGLKVYHTGSDHVGAVAIMNILAPYQLPNYVLEDGAGASTYNLVTPTVMTQLLYHAYQDKVLANFLLSALPVIDEDGTLKDFPSNLLKGKIIAKTGTMTGVASLSGFMTSSQGRLLIFSLLIDNTPEPNHQLKLIQAKVLQDLYQNT